MLPSHSETLEWPGGRQRPCTDCVVGGGMGGSKRGEVRKSGVLVRRGQKKPGSQFTALPIVAKSQAHPMPPSFLLPLPPQAVSSFSTAEPPPSKTMWPRGLTPLPVNAGRLSSCYHRAYFHREASSCPNYCQERLLSPRFSVKRQHCIMGRELGGQKFSPEFWSPVGTEALRDLEQVPSPPGAALSFM